MYRKIKINIRQSEYDKILQVVFLQMSAVCEITSKILVLMVDFEIEYKDRENTGIYRTQEISLL